MHELGEFIYGEGNVRPCEAHILKVPNYFAIFSCIYKGCTIKLHTKEKNYTEKNTKNTQKIRIGMNSYEARIPREGKRISR